MIQLSCALHKVDLGIGGVKRKIFGSVQAVKSITPIAKQRSLKFETAKYRTFGRGIKTNLQLG